MPEEERLRQARLRRKTANTWRSQQCYAEAWRDYDMAQRRLGPKPISSDPSWWETWLDIQLDRADMLYFQRRLPKLAELCEEMREPIEVYGSPAQRADFFSRLVMLNNRQIGFRPSARSVEYARTALKWAKKTDDERLISQKLFSLGFSLLWFGDLEESAEQMTAALLTAERTGDIHLQDQCLAYLTVIFRLKGDLRQVGSTLQKGLEIATVEQNPMYIGVAKANLAWLEYRRGVLREASRNGRAALERWQALAYPMQWLARWPLLAVALLQDDVAEALDQTRALLGPKQQTLPDALTTVMMEAIRAAEAGREEAAHKHLDRAVTLARKMGHL